MTKEQKVIRFITRPMVEEALAQNDNDLAATQKTIYASVLKDLELEDNSNVHSVCDHRVKGLVGYLERIGA